jgi:hypothetical protein
LPEGTEGDPKAGGNATVFISGDAHGLTGIGALGGGRDEDIAEGGELSRVLEMVGTAVGGDSGSMMLTPDGMESERAGFG